MFRSEINAGLLKSSVDTVSVLVDECKVRLDEDGLSIKAVDPANVGMVELDIPADSFDSYEADDELLGLNLVRFEDIVGMANKGDTVVMELDEETRKLTIRIDGLRYTLSLIDPDSIHQEPNVPDLDLPGDVGVAGRELRRGVKAAGMVSDHMAFGVSGDDGTFYMRAEGDTDDVRVDLTEDDVISLDTGGEEAESLFSLDYLDSMAKAIPNDAAVEVEVGDDYPVKMNFDVSGGEAKVTYLLAPRIENE
jgi:proliferating cell nuclear antigen